MKINNITKFFGENNEDSSFSQAQHRSTIVTRKDIIKLYAESDSENPQDWHRIPTETDEWWKMSFDGGYSFPIKMKFNENSPSAEFIIERTSAESGQFVTYTTTKDDQTFQRVLINITKSFEIDKDYIELKKGLVKAFAIDSNGYYNEISNFSYKFTDAATTGEKGTLDIKIEDEDASSDITGVIVQIKTGMGGLSTTILNPTQSTLVSAIPSVYDDTYGTCNYLDDDISSIECLTKVSDIGVIKLKVVSADKNVTGSAVVTITCESFSQSFNIDNVTGTEKLVTLELDSVISGTLLISRDLTSVNDTLKVTSGDETNVISLIITQIKVETI